MPRAEPGFTVASFNIHYATGGDRRFDRIYASAEPVIEAGGVFEPSAVRRASDHLPVVARIGFAI